MSKNCTCVLVVILWSFRITTYGASNVGDILQETEKTLSARQKTSAWSDSNGKAICEFEMAYEKSDINRWHKRILMWRK